MKEIKSLTEALAISIVLAYASDTEEKKLKALRFVSDFMDHASLREVGEAMITASLQLEELKIEDTGISSAFNMGDLN